MLLNRLQVACPASSHRYVPSHNVSRKLNRPQRKKLLTSTEYAIDEDIITFKNMVFDVSNEVDIMTSLKIKFEPYYRVVLVYNNWEDDKNAAARLILAVHILDPKQGIHVAKNARKEGLAIVVTVMQQDAEIYLHKMRKVGLDGYTEIA